MSDITTPNGTPGLPAPIPPTPAAPSAVQPNPAAHPPNQSAASNQPDADTAAGASIPKALVNNPAAPTQKMGDKADRNKTVPAPAHLMLRRAAEELAGGPTYRTPYHNDGNAISTPVQPSL